MTPQDAAEPCILKYHGYRWWGITFYEGKGCRSFKDSLARAESTITKLVTEYPMKSETVSCPRT